MSKPQVAITNSFDEWRAYTNTISNNVGDPSLVTEDPLYSGSTIQIWYRH